MHRTGYEEYVVLMHEEELKHPTGFGCVGHLEKGNKDLIDLLVKFADIELDDIFEFLSVV